MFDSKAHSGNFMEDDDDSSNPFESAKMEASRGDPANAPSFPPKSEGLQALVRQKVPSRLKVLVGVSLFFIPLLATEISTLVSHPQVAISGCSLDGGIFTLETCFAAGVTNCTDGLSYDIMSNVLTNDIFFQVVFYLQFSLLVVLMLLVEFLFFWMLSKSQTVLKLLPHRVYIGMRKTGGVFGLIALVILGAAYVLIKWKSADLLARDSVVIACNGRSVYLRLAGSYFDAMFGLGKHLFVTLTVFLGPVKPLAERIWNLYIDLDLKALLKDTEDDGLEDIATIQKIDFNDLLESIRECLEKKYPSLSPSELDQICDIRKISNEHMQASLAHVRMHKPQLFKPIND
eukprot:TRINITY_DN11573_c0_g1_i1.p1 TRINITY_DN11573_c0_g1~~TRINITY_DN11573_c0_g1_i1.p1  ORF type:complete len:356 (+),score=81.98 TRINITY_DN11573_c0_g1_i1:34-1068(+)